MAQKAHYKQTNQWRKLLEREISKSQWTENAQWTEKAQ